MNTKTTTHGDMLRAHADIADYSSRGDFTAQYLRDAAGIIDAQAEEISSLRAERERCIGPLVPKDQLDKSKARVADLEEALERISQLSFYDGADFCHPEGCEAPRIARAVLSKRSAE